MSDYLVQRLKSSLKVTLYTRTEITALDGDGSLQRVTFTNRDTGATEIKNISNLFVMIGAQPNTDWLDGCPELDHYRNRLRQNRLRRQGRFAALGVCDNPASAFYAVGDVRSGSVKRVASSVGSAKAQWSFRQFTSS